MKGVNRTEVCNNYIHSFGVCFFTLWKVSSNSKSVAHPFVLYCLVFKPRQHMIKNFSSRYIYIQRIIFNVSVRSNNLIKGFLLGYLMISLLHLGFSCRCSPTYIESICCNADRSTLGRVISQFKPCSKGDCEVENILNHASLVSVVRFINIFTGPPVKR